MSNIINSEAYVKLGDKVYKVNGGGGGTGGSAGGSSAGSKLYHHILAVRFTDTKSNNIELFADYYSHSSELPTTVTIGDLEGMNITSVLVENDTISKVYLFGKFHRNWSDTEVYCSLQNLEKGDPSYTLVSWGAKTNTVTIAKAESAAVEVMIGSEYGGGTGGDNTTSTPKIIDLNDARYGGGLGDIIFSRIGQSGKYTHEINDTDEKELFRNLFVDFNTDQPVILRVSTSGNSMAVDTTAFYKSYMNGTLAQVSVSTVTSLAGNIFNFKVTLEDGDPCRMYVVCSVE